MTSTSKEALKAALESAAIQLAQAAGHANDLNEVELAREFQRMYTRLDQIQREALETT